MRRRSVPTGLLVTLLWASGPRPSAHAFDARVDSETRFSMFDVQSPATDVVWERRRVTQDLELRLVEHLADAPGHGAPRPTLIAQVHLRLDEDFGPICLIGEDTCYRVHDPRQRGSFDAFSTEPALDMPLAYLEAAELPMGLGARFGRQLNNDVFGFSRVDGLTARFAPAPWVAVSALGGAHVRNTTLAGSNAFVPVGIPRLGLEPEELARLPDVEGHATTWLLGGQLELGEPQWLRGRLAYRRLFEEAGVVRDQAGLGLDSRPLDALLLDAHGVMEVTDWSLVDGQAGARLRTGPVTSQLNISRHVPRFDQGSIWAYFRVAPTWEGTAGATVHARENVTVFVAVRARRAELEQDVSDDDLGGEGSVNWLVGGFDLNLSGFGWGGGLGPLWGADFHGEKRVARWLILDARLSLWLLNDPLREAMDGLSMGENLTARVPIGATSELSAELAHSYSDPIGHRLRLIASLYLGAWR